MEIGVCLLTCGRPELTAKTWWHNLKRAGYPYRLFWYDNGSSEADYLRIVDESWEYPVEWHEFSEENEGIAIGLNRMISAAFSYGCDAVLTMANDILEPDGWLLRRVTAANAIPKTGVVSIASTGIVGIDGSHTSRYREKEENGVQIEEGGDVIGNYLITKEAYEKVGLFCTDYGIYGPIDLDYCYRLRCAGLRYYYAPGPTAVHIGTLDASPEEYNETKRKSLAGSWQRFTFNQEAYKIGEKIYQHAT